MYLIAIVLCLALTISLLIGALRTQNNPYAPKRIELPGRDRRAEASSQNEERVEVDEALSDWTIVQYEYPAKASKVRVLKGEGRSDAPPPLIRHLPGSENSHTIRLVGEDGIHFFIEVTEAHVVPGVTFPPAPYVTIPVTGPTAKAHTIVPFDGRTTLLYRVERAGVYCTPLDMTSGEPVPMYVWKNSVAGLPLLAFDSFLLGGRALDGSFIAYKTQGGAIEMARVDQHNPRLCVEPLHVAQLQSVEVRVNSVHLATCPTSSSCMLSYTLEGQAGVWMGGMDAIGPPKKASVVQGTEDEVYQVLSTRFIPDTYIVCTLVRIIGGKGEMRLVVASSESTVFIEPLMATGNGGALCRHPTDRTKLMAICTNKSGGDLCMIGVSSMGVDLQRVIVGRLGARGLGEQVVASGGSASLVMFMSAGYDQATCLRFSETEAGVLEVSDVFINATLNRCDDGPVKYSYAFFETPGTTLMTESVTRGGMASLAVSNVGIKRLPLAW